MPDPDAGVDAGEREAGVDAGTHVEPDAGPTTCTGASMFAVVQFSVDPLAGHAPSCGEAKHFYSASARFSTDPASVLTGRECANGTRYGSCCYVEAEGCVFFKDGGSKCSGTDGGDNLPPPPCLPGPDGGLICTDAGVPLTPNVVGFNAGTLTFGADGAALKAVAYSAQTDGYEWQLSDPLSPAAVPPYADGAALSIAGSGGPDVAAFSTGVHGVAPIMGFYPSDCDAGVIPLVDSAQDTQFTWTPDPEGSSEVFFTTQAVAVGTDRPGGLLTCWAADSDGVLTVPAAALGKLPPSTLLTVALSRDRRHLACPGSTTETVPAGLSVTVHSTEMTSATIQLK